MAQKGLSISASEEAARVQIATNGLQNLSNNSFYEEVCRRKGIPPAVSRVGSEPRQVPVELSSLVKECEAISDHLSVRITPIAHNVVS